MTTNFAKWKHNVLDYIMHVSYLENGISSINDKLEQAKHSKC